jgi:hypothetical protein
MFLLTRSAAEIVVRFCVSQPRSGQIRFTGNEVSHPGLAIHVKPMLNYLSVNLMFR